MCLVVYRDVETMNIICSHGDVLCMPLVIFEGVHLFISFILPPLPFCANDVGKDFDLVHTHTHTQLCIYMCDSTFSLV